MSAELLYLILAFTALVGVSWGVVIIQEHRSRRFRRLMSQTKATEVPRLPLVFDLPHRHRYDPSQFEHPLTCVTCDQPILDGAYFFEIPILNGKPNAMLAVCLQCDSRSPYDKLEAEDA
jgi:hypothetical protein